MPHSPPTTGQVADQSDLDQIDLEIFRCLKSPAWFIWHHCYIKDEQTAAHVPFKLWPDQTAVLKGLATHRLVVLLKARQIGMTTIVLCYAIWKAIFRPGSQILLFSKTLLDARDLIKRIRATIVRLPPWLQPRGFTVDSTQELAFTNGSSFKAFASKSSGGDSYTASLVIVDEADLIPDLDELLSGAKPTIDAGGQLILLSRPDKSKPESSFKKVYRAAPANGFWASFLPWMARPDRTREWYDAIRAEIVARTGGIDELWEQYPESAEQALAPAQLLKRLPLAWLEACVRRREPLPMPLDGAPAYPGLLVYRTPCAGHQYAIGADPAEGNPTSDDSAAVILDCQNGEEVALLRGKYEPTTFATMLDTLGVWYNKAALNIERNNHGHAVIAWCRDNGKCDLLPGYDNDMILAESPGQLKYGWLSNAKGKALLYATAATAFRDGQTIIHSAVAFQQLASVDGATLRAPQGQHDDVAIAYVLAVVGVVDPPRFGGVVIIDGAGPEPGKAPPPKPTDGDQSWLFDDAIWPTN